MKQPMKTRTRITLPYIYTASEIASRLLRPSNIDVTYKPTNKLGYNFTKHKSKTTKNTTPSICLTVLIVQKETLVKHQKRYRERYKFVYLYKFKKSNVQVQGL